jgi:hypothetical protein
MVCPYSVIKDILALILVFIIYKMYSKKKIKEKFWNYETARSHFYCKYGRRSPHRCSKLEHSFHNFRQQIHANPVGFVHAKDESLNLKYPLLSWLDNYTGSYKYYIKDYKSLHSKEYILNEIANQNNILMEGDEIDVKGKEHLGKFIVKIHNNNYTMKEYSPYGSGTRYDYHNVPWNTIGYIVAQETSIDDDNRFYILYEKELDPSKSEYEYKINIRTGFPIFLDLKDKEQLYHGDVVKIPGSQIPYTVYKYSLESGAFY